MAWTVAEVEGFISTLERGLAAGTVTLTFPDRSQVTYDTGRRIIERIGYFRALKAELESGGTPAPRRILHSPSSGIEC